MLDAPRTAAPASEVVRPSTIEAMWQWVAYRSSGDYGAISGIYGTGSNLLGRLQNGKRFQVCKRCNGDGRIPVPGYKVRQRCPVCKGARYFFEDLAPIDEAKPVACKTCEVIEYGVARSTGEVNGATCISCRGSGERIETKRTVHPALIPGTRRYSRATIDMRSALINQLVFSWEANDATFWWHHVVLSKYRPADQRTDEAKAAEMGLSKSFFSKCLKRAHLAVQERLETAFKK